jgi:predicted RNA-binding protein with PUA-like domain
MISDEKLIEAVREMDDFLSEMLMKYQISTLSMNAMMLARLMRLSIEAGTDTDFRKIMSEALTTTTETTNNRILQ